MFEMTPPWQSVHETTGLSLARWQLVEFKFTPVFASQRIFLGVVPLLSNYIKHDAKGIPGGEIADLAIPLGIVPCNAEC